MNLLLVFTLTIVGFQICLSCDMDQIRRGCRIQNRMCSCGTGCISEYRYANLKECQAALKGKKRDICNPNPCVNEGSCLQISQHPGYKCRCEGTGFFGARCNRACPIPGAGGIGDKVFPYECIVI
ncbi:adhesive plaque matrix protein 2-like [Agrilus planipennis]|uniref:Adhesive plaque matrix protein 2-like n=1 Tax=Agrilus planipennis TaxID=224129 RepID=A0A7F5RJH4_AGRPL|nr:adhesive plaque matrix protein 2-like [Agrilus planipennis]